MYIDTFTEQNVAHFEKYKKEYTKNIPLKQVAYSVVFVLFAALYFGCGYLLNNNFLYVAGVICTLLFIATPILFEIEKKNFVKNKSVKVKRQGQKYKPNITQYGLSIKATDKTLDISYNYKSTPAVNYKDIKKSYKIDDGFVLVDKRDNKYIFDGLTEKEIEYLQKHTKKR